METLRALVSHIHTPHRLDTPQIRALLQAHRRLPHVLTPTAVGAAAARLLVDKIAALEAPLDAPAKARLPHQVFETCFLRGRKNFQAAAELGISERQLTRERERALRLLSAELAASPAFSPRPEPIPSIEGHIQRGDLLRRLTEAAAHHRLVAMLGEPGAGKTSLAAALAHALGRETVWWYRIRPSINDSLEALLLELGHVLAREGSPELRDYLSARLVDVDLGTATRVALQGLAGRRRVLILDDFDIAGEAEPITGWVEEAVVRVPELSIVTIGGAVVGAVCVDVPPLTRAETALLLRATARAPASYVLDSLLQLTGGNALMLAAVTTWWSGDDRGLCALERHLQGRNALANLADLVAFTGRVAA